MHIPHITSDRISQADLLRTIRQAILEEPRRVDMNDWIFSVEGKYWEGIYEPPTVDVKKYGDTSMSFPDCGTVACLAGWGALLLTNMAPHLLLGPRGESVPAFMERLLDAIPGGNTVDTEDLFGSAVLNPDYDESQEELDPEYAKRVPFHFERGTPEYVQAVARRIDDYIATYPQTERNIINRLTWQVEYAESV